MKNGKVRRLDTTINAEIRRTDQQIEHLTRRRSQLAGALQALSGTPKVKRRKRRVNLKKTAK